MMTAGLRSCLFRCLMLRYGLPSGHAVRALLAVSGLYRPAAGHLQVVAYEESQKYKEGRYIIEKQKVMKVRVGQCSGPMYADLPVSLVAFVGMPSNLQLSTSTAVGPLAVHPCQPLSSP